MNTYAALIIYKIRTLPQEIEQYDEQWRLIYAADEREAMTKAQRVAQDGEEQFLDRHGRLVAWELIGIKDLQRFEIKDGSLLCSAVKEVMPITGPMWEPREP